MAPMLPCLECKVQGTKYDKRREYLLFVTERLVQTRDAVIQDARAMKGAVPQQQIESIIALARTLAERPQHANKVHPFQYAPPEAHEPAVKALRCPFVQPVPTKSSMLHLSRCAACRHRDPLLLKKLDRMIEATEAVTRELDGVHRRLKFQLQTPGGPQQLPECLEGLLKVEIDLTDDRPKLWERAVSPRFLRRLCKLYTSNDLIVDHQIPALHARSDVDRSPHLGELFVGDRYREFPEGITPPKYETADDWATHIVKAACKQSQRAFVCALHADPATVVLPQRNHATPVRPTADDISRDERGAFPVYGPTTFYVSYSRAHCSFYELCEAVWRHWTTYCQERPDVPRDSVFYWIDIFAVNVAELHEPLSKRRKCHDTELVIRNCTGGVLVYADPWCDVVVTRQLQCLWDTYQATRWLKTIGIIRPLEFFRQAFLHSATMGKVQAGTKGELRLQDRTLRALADFLEDVDASAARGDDDSMATDAREFSPKNVAEYAGFRRLLEMQVEAVPSKLTDAQSRSPDDQATVLADLRALRARTEDVIKGLREAMTADLHRMAFAKACKEGQSVAALTLMTMHHLKPDVSVGQLLPFFVLPADGVTPESMLHAVTQAMLAGHMLGDARCGAGMNVLHYVAIQPDLLLGPGNLMLRLVKLLVKCGPDFNAQDFWGQTPLNLLLLHTALKFRDDSSAKLWARLAEVLAFFLGQGADPTVANVRGENAYAVGSARAQQALTLAEAVCRGEAALEATDDGDGTDGSGGDATTSGSVVRGASIAAKPDLYRQASVSVDASRLELTTPARQREEMAARQADDQAQLEDNAAQTNDTAADSVALEATRSTGTDKIPSSESYAECQGGVDADDADCLCANGSNDLAGDEMQQAAIDDPDSSADAES